MKPSGIGGQAVIEGVMMKNKDQYAIAVRKPDNEIIVEKNTFKSVADKYKLFKLPIFRGMSAFAESMIIGTKTLNFSASFYEEEEQAKETKFDKAFSKVFKDKAEGILMALTFMVAIIMAVGIFIIIPAFAAGQLGKQIESPTLTAVVEGLIRILLFVLYVFAISQLKDIQRIFMYHGAEHKTINCLEQGFELTVENVKWQSREHKRCGTSFMFIVMFVSIIFFIFIRVDEQWLRYIIRILLIPVIAGVSYEFIRFAGKNDSKVVQILSKPGMWLQGLTTREPDDEMIEVAIQSVEAVFDWHEFLGIKEVATETNENDNNKNTRKKNTNNQNSNRNKSGNKNRKSNNKNSERNNTESQKTASNSNKQNSNINKEKVGQKPQSQNNRSNRNKKNKANQEFAASSSKNLNISKDGVFGEEEDEILRALDDYVVSKEENKDHRA